MLVRFSSWVIESTGVGPLRTLRATSAPITAGLVEVEKVGVADDRRIVVEGLDRLSDPDLEAVGVGHLDIAPTAEATVVVDRGAPRVACRRRLLLGRAGALLAPRDLDDQ